MTHDLYRPDGAHIPTSNYRPRGPRPPATTRSPGHVKVVDLLLRPRPCPPPGAPPRRRVVALVVGAAGLSVLLLTAVVMTFTNAIDTDPPHPPSYPAGPAVSPAGPAVTPSRPGPVSEQTRMARDRLAAAPMPKTGTGNAYNRPQLSTRDPGVIRLPPARSVGGWGVRTGYPQTPEGALAQLAAINVATFQSASTAGARAVIRDWAAPGGPTPTSWSGVRAMASLVQSAGVSGPDPLLSMQAIPQMGLIKGVVGDDFVVACVDMSIDIHYGGTSRIAAVDCQRMLWLNDRWVIGPGPEPAPATSVWPGTDAAIDAGYKDLQ